MISFAHHIFDEHKASEKREFKNIEIPANSFFQKKKSYCQAGKFIILLKA